MLTSKVFLKKTKRGNILKVNIKVRKFVTIMAISVQFVNFQIVREHYLRDDIGCGSFACDECSDINEFAILEAKPPHNINKAYKNPHYLVLDTNVVLHQVCDMINFKWCILFCIDNCIYADFQIDVIEADVLCNVIILQTVLEEVKHRSTTIYKRLRDIISNTNRKFYVFVNEHHKYVGQVSVCKFLSLFSLNHLFLKGHLC